MTTKTHLILMSILLIVSLLLSACGGDEEVGVAGSSGSSSQNQRADSDSTDNNTASDTESVQLPSPLDNMVTEQWSFDNASPGFIIPQADIDLGFVFVVNRTLFHGRFNGEVAPVINLRMTAASVNALPDGLILYRGNGTETRNAVLVQDPTQTEFLAEYPLRFDGIILNWNADGTWFAYFDGDLYIAAADGSFKSEPIHNAAESTWLDDDTLLYTVFDEDGVVISVMRYDPMTETSTEMPLEFDPATDDLSSLEDDLRELGYRYSSPNVLELSGATPDGETRFIIRFPENPSATGICDEWTIERTDPNTGDRETVYTDDTTHALTNLNVLPDGSVLVLRWFREDCAFSNPIQAELLHLMPDGEVETVTDKILVNTSQVQLFTLERRYTVSPDGRYVMWIGRDVGVEGDATLELLDLESNVQKRVAQMPSVVTGGFSVFFSSVTWLH